MASENNSEENNVYQHELNLQEAKISQVAVVMVPIPAQGDLGPLLHLSRLVSGHNLPVHYVGTTTVIRQAQSRVHSGWDPSSDRNIHFHEFPTPSNSPNSNGVQGVAKSLMATTHQRGPVHAFVKQLSPKHKRVVVIYDYYMSYVVQDIDSVPNAEGYVFRVSSAFATLCFELNLDKGKQNALSIQPEVAEILKETPSAGGNIPPEFREYMDMQRKARNVSSGEIYNSNRLTEDIFLNLMAELNGTGTENIWALGPFNLLSMNHDDHLQNQQNRHKCLDWLDRHEADSVIYVSFGTTSSLSDDEIKAIAIGLERSEQKFIWVLRDSDSRGGTDRRDRSLPEGFEGRMFKMERGIIVRDWAPQLEILGHTATGGFFSHCGWNSWMESISMGVPIAGWAMHTDHPMNAVLMTKILRIGVEVLSWDRRRNRGENVSGGSVEEAVRIVMASEQGNDMRRRARGLGDAVRKSVMEQGGATRVEKDSFIARITR